MKTGALLLALAFATAGCGDDPTVAPHLVRSPTSRAIRGGPNCRLPSEKPTPHWVPKDVPLPPRTYFYKELKPKRDHHRGLFVLRIDAKTFRRFTNARWTAAGIRLLRPDQEPGEVEAIFTTPGGTGVFKANDVICATPYTRLLLIYGT